MNGRSFDDLFKALTDLPGPLAWQSRLYNEFLHNTVRPVCDLPTGMGKTAIIPIWLIARAHQVQSKCAKLLPTRLVYVVDRRTVVDQATTFAEKIKKKLDDDSGLLGLLGTPVAVSTLRGQLADNRKWSSDPSRPAIIIGTVDLIGSALLFSGYRSSYKRRPLEAGLLGQDSLLVLDEAHLSKPFEKLVKSISLFQTGQGTPMKVIRMSATTGGEESDRFSLMPADLVSRIENGEETNPIVQRFTAKKHLTIEPPVEKKAMNASMCKAAVELGKDNSRVVVFVRSPDDAKNIAKEIRAHESTKSKSGPFVDSVAVLTGTMRGLERDQMLEPPVDGSTESIDLIRRVMRRFLDPDNRPDEGPAILVSTSAGEVGFDLNADHMVCDAAPLDSMIQRLGRVNRRGKGDALVRVFVEKDAKQDKPFDKASAKAMELLKDQTDVSPKALGEFKSKLTSKLTPEQLKVAWPEPTMVDLTDILLDAWSMTSIVEPMPGRPEVAPWLRGIDDELPQTTIAWRAELELFGILGIDPIPPKTLKAMLAKHRIRPHEALTTNSYRVADFLKAITAPKKRPSLRATRVVVKFSRDLIVTTIGDLVDDPSPLNADPMLILPATFGGLDKNGMLSEDSIPPEPKPEDTESPTSFDVADEAGYEPRESAPVRLRVLIERTEEGRWKLVRLPGGRSMPGNLALEPFYDSSAHLLKALVEQTALSIRLVQPINTDEEGNDVRSLVMLSAPRDDKKPKEQLLDDHVTAVEEAATTIAMNLSLQEPFLSALRFAAKWHDEGKKAPIWQRWIGGTAERPLGKSSITNDPKKLRHYRHEFGSLLRVLHPDLKDQKATRPQWTAEEEARELALHLIAVHHGFSRPHFAHPCDNDFHDPRKADGVHLDAIRRFARLQRKYGHWRLAWLENLLRCADALASADNDVDDVQEGDSEGED